MLLPPFGAKENKNVRILRFGGLDQREKAGAESLFAAENLSADAYPALTLCKSRRRAAEDTGITAVCAPEYSDAPLTAFTGVKNNRFYYQGKMAEGTALSAGEKSIADFNGKICIFPDKVYYDYLPDPETGEVDNSLKSMEKTLTVTGVSFYGSQNSLTGVCTAYLSKSNAGFDRFQPGESIIISGCKKTENNVCQIEGRKDMASETTIVSAVVESAAAGKLELLLFNRRGERTAFASTTESGEITIGVSIPSMDHVCVHNNRLWGTAANGEYVYASKLGDCFNFNSFQGLGDDSWYSAIGTPGTFTGICSYRTAVVAFKRDCIHHVYGDAPQNFSIPKQTMGGCIDGRSITELGGVLYYLSAAGFYGYSGGEPYFVSPQLTAAYVSCAAGTDGKRYYAAAYQSDGSCDVLVYDPAYQTWHREDDTAFLGFVRHGGRLYAAAQNGLYELCAGEEPESFSFTTQNLTYDTMEHKGLNCVWLRMKAKTDTQVRISVSRDGGPFAVCAEYLQTPGLGVRRVPVRFGACDSFQIQVSGYGRAVFYDLELITHQGGKTYGI